MIAWRTPAYISSRRDTISIKKILDPINKKAFTLSSTQKVMSDDCNVPCMLFRILCFNQTNRPNQTSRLIISVPKKKNWLGIGKNCVKSNWDDQNLVLIKLISGEFGNTEENKVKCLEARSCHEGAYAVTGCEMIWGTTYGDQEGGWGSYRRGSSL